MGFAQPSAIWAGERCFCSWTLQASVRRRCVRNSGVSIGASGRVRHLLVATVAASLLATACTSGHPRSRARNGVTAPAPSRAADTRWTTTPGTAVRRCVTVGHRSEVRSGSFIVGNFQAYAADWNGTPDRSKLYYIPLYPQGKPPLDVRAEALGGSAAPSPMHDLAIVTFSARPQLGSSREHIAGSGVISASTQIDAVMYRSRGLGRLPRDGRGRVDHLGLRPRKR